MNPLQSKILRTTSTKFCFPRHLLLSCSLLLFIATSSLPITAGAQSVFSEERQKGIELYREGKHEESKKQLRKAVARNKTDAEAWYYLGLALLQRGKDIKDAIKAFQTAIILQPNLAAAHIGLGHALLARNKLPEAMREARLALAIEPGLAEAHHFLGLVYLRSFEYEEALREASEAIALSRELAGPYFLKCEALLGIHARKVIESRARSVSWSQLSPEEQAERRKKRSEGNPQLLEAAESLETYLKLNPSDPSAETWREQVETLRVFGAARKVTNTEEFFSGVDVSTKARILAKPIPSYTDSARDAGIAGTVILRAVFSADGTVRHVLVITGLPYGLTERALQAARKIKFEPAKINDRPVSMFVQLEYNFNLY